MKIKAWAAKGPNQKLEPFEYDPGPLRADDVKVTVENSGLCHSDVSAINNEWRFTKYPLVPGHEVIGRVFALGSSAKGLEIGQRVGVGWTAGTCMHCEWCIGCDANLCPQSMPTIVGHYGGFAEHVGARGSFRFQRESMRPTQDRFCAAGHRIHAAQSFRSEVDRQSSVSSASAASDTWR